MTATAKPFFVRLRAALNKKREHRKEWARVEEPDQFLQNVFRTILTLVMTGLVGVMIYNVFSLPGGILAWIAAILVETADGAPFEQVYAAFGLAVLALCYLLVLVLHIMLGHADNDDVIEMTGDMDANTQERLAELEHSITERLDRIERNQ